MKGFPVVFVRDLPTEAVFVSVDSEVVYLNLEHDTDFDSFFEVAVDGEIKQLWGMYGIIPGNNNLVFLV